MKSLTSARDQSDILASLRRLKGRATVGDVVAASGLPADSVRAGLKTLLATHQGHLEVSDTGELVYDFDRRLIERGSEPFVIRAKNAISSLARGAFKGWIVVMLVGYFVVFVALVIAALLAGQKDGDRGGFGGNRRRGGFPIDPMLLYWIWGPRWRIGRPYYGHRWERTLSQDDKVPFYKKVFAFVFGPDRPTPTARQLDRSKLRLIRARNGVLTTAELVEHTGETFDGAEADMARLLGQYDGEAVVSPDGELVYAFPEVMKSVEESRSVREPNPAWLRLEPQKELTGNTAGANAGVAAMNAFTLVASATAPWFIFPRLGIGGPAAFVGLVVVPLVYSVLFFGTPLVRMVGVSLENRRRRRRNMRRVLLGLVYERSLAGAPLTVGEATDFVATRLAGRRSGGAAGVEGKEHGSGRVERSDVERLLRELASELDADVHVDESGEVAYTFTAIKRQFTAGEVVRRTLRLEKGDIGDIVFATSDSPEKAGERELAAFDQELLDAGVDLGAYLPSVDRIGFEEDYDLIAFDEELSRRAVDQRG